MEPLVALKSLATECESRDVLLWYTIIHLTRFARPCLTFQKKREF